jgi:hypothetical protein
MLAANRAAKILLVGVIRINDEVGLRDDRVL